MNMIIAMWCFNILFQFMCFTFVNQLASLIKTESETDRVQLQTYGVYSYNFLQLTYRLQANNIYIFLLNMQSFKLSKT